MLTVAIELNGNVKTIPLGEEQAGLNGATNPKVERQTYGSDVQLAGHLTGAVGGAIVYHQDSGVGRMLSEITDNARKAGFLVEGRDYYTDTWLRFISIHLVSGRGDNC